MIFPCIICSAVEYQVTVRQSAADTRSYRLSRYRCLSLPPRSSCIVIRHRDLFPPLCFPFPSTNIEFTLVSTILRLSFHQHLATVQPESQWRSTDSTSPSNHYHIHLRRRSASCLSQRKDYWQSSRSASMLCEYRR